MIVLLMGVSGSGKTTVGRALAGALGWTFADADAHHSAESRAKMAAGIPLDDADRAPWLERLAGMVDGWLVAGTNAVLACSALKDAYRRRLVRDPARVRVVYLRGSSELLAERMRARAGHFMPASLLASQLATLEEPGADAVTVDVTPPPAEIVASIRRALGV